MKAQPANSISQHFVENIKIKWLILAAGIIGLAAVMRLINLTNQGLFYDELQSVTFAHLPLKELLKNIYTFDYHPPLYYLQLHFWMHVSTSDAWVRLNSVFWGILTTTSLIITGWQIYGRRTAFLAAALFAISPVAVHYGKEARMYAMLMFLAVWIWFFTIQFFNDWHPWVSAAGILASTSAFLYSQGAAFLIFPATFIYASLFWVVNRSKWQKLAGWGVLQIILLAIYFPWMLRAITLSDAHSPVPSIANITTTFSQLLFGYSNIPFTGSTVLAWAVLGFLTYILLRSKETLVFYLAFVVSPLISCLVISYLFLPIWLTRTVAFLAPFLSLSIALALQKLLVYFGGKQAKSYNLLGYVIVAFVFIGFIACLFYEQNTFKQIWAPRAAIELVNREALPSDIVAIANRRMFWGWCWYAVKPGCINPVSGNYSVVSQRGNPTILAEGKLAPYLIDGKTIWFVYRDIDDLSILPDIPGMKREVVYDDLRLVVEKITLEKPGASQP